MNIIYFSGQWKEVLWFYCILLKFFIYNGFKYIFWNANKENYVSHFCFKYMKVGWKYDLIEFCMFSNGWGTIMYQCVF